jgi:hypothetical protein
MQVLGTDFRAALGQPEYIHVLLNPLPIYGLAAGLFVLAFAWAAHSRSGQAIALVLIVLTAASAWPVAYFGHAAYDRVYSMSGGAAQKWLNWHENLADRIVWAYYAAAAVAAAALAALWKFPSLHRIALALTLAAGLVAMGFGAFLGFVGGKIRHSEFRNGPPPPWADTSGEYDRP